MYKIFLTEPIHQYGIDILEKIGKVTIGSNIEEETIIKEAKDHDAMLIRSAKITRKIINEIPTLKVIAKHGIGVDNIDLKEADKKDIVILNAPEANINAVAEHAAMLILSSCKNLVFTDKFTRAGEFKKRNTYPTIELKGKTIGFIGMGKIASLVAKKLSSFEANIIAYDPGKTTSDHSDIVGSLDEIYEKSDIISIHVPLIESTKDLISKESISKMKDDVIIINTARGGIVNEVDLYDALINNKVSLAALDVFEQEPLSIDNPLLKLDNIILTPHNAALTHEALINMAVDASQGISDYLTDKEPKYIVSPKSK